MRALLHQYKHVTIYTRNCKTLRIEWLFDELQAAVPYGEKAAIKIVILHLLSGDNITTAIMLLTLRGGEIYKLNGTNIGTSIHYHNMG